MAERYTITRADLDRLVAARALQVEKARQAHILAYGPESLPTLGQVRKAVHAPQYAALNPEIVPTEWHNGSIERRVLRLDRLSKWASLLSPGATHLEISFEQDHVTHWKAQTGAATVSEILLCDFPMAIEEVRGAFVPIKIIQDGQSLCVDGPVDAREQLRAAKANRDDIARLGEFMKRLRRIQEAERSALSALRTGAREEVERQAYLATRTREQALDQERRYQAARKVSQAYSIWAVPPKPHPWFKPEEEMLFQSLVLQYSLAKQLAGRIPTLRRGMSREEKQAIWQHRNLREGEMANAQRQLHTLLLGSMRSYLAECYGADVVSDAMGTWREHVRWFATRRTSRAWPKRKRELAERYVQLLHARRAMEKELKGEV